MTSVFDEMVDKFMVPQAMHFLGEVKIIAYEDAAGSSTADITAIIDDEKVTTEIGPNGPKKIRTREVHCHRDPDSDWSGIADPDLRGKVTYDSGEWSIREVFDGDNIWVHFEMTYIRPHELNAGDLRR